MPNHDPKLTSFLALRANGWSLASISRQLNIPKSTLWDWDNKHQGEVHLLKHLQLEKLQEKFMPTYEEELSSLRSYLDRLEAALEESHLGRMEPGQLFQTILQVRSRLSRMREQVPLRNVPFNQPMAPLPFTGCVTRQDDEQFRAEHLQDPAAREPVSPTPAENPIRTNPDKTPPRAPNGPLILNDLQTPAKNGRPDLHSQNGHHKT